jgi:hypothetical protein
MPGPISVHETGLDELVVALRGVDDQLLEAMQLTMQEAGDVVRDDARRKFTTKFEQNRSVRSAESVARSAENFQTQTRGILVGHRVRTIVGQRLRKRTGRRPDWGREQMRFGLVPARDEHIEETAVELDRSVGRLLREHGF